MSASHFKNLEVWQVAMSLVKNVYELTAGFPSGRTLRIELSIAASGRLRSVQRRRRQCQKHDA